MRNMRSFEVDINKQFPLTKSEAASKHSKRSGLIGYKVGMTHFWDKWGAMVPCSVIQVDRCQVTQVKTKEKDGKDAIQLGIGEKAPHKVNKP